MAPKPLQYPEETQKKHPYGTTLLAKDTPENRALFGDDGVGTIEVADSVCTADGQCPHYSYKKDATVADALIGGENGEATGALKTPIHLMIAAFRDQLCSRTLHNAFTRAENPKRLFIRVVDQTDPSSDKVDDAGCWERYCSEYNPNCDEYRANVKVVHVDSTKARGPCDARSKLSHMVQWDYRHADSEELDFVPVRLEDFCMQTDSHMDFSNRFDTKLIEMHHRAENDYAVLSTYVAAMNQNNHDEKVIQNGRNVVPNLCMVEFRDSIRNWGTKQCVNLVRPKLTNAMWGAGLSFHRCHAEINVPYDPYLLDVFNGEEGSRGIRFFTHGYDVYTPDSVVVTHDYDGHQSNPVIHTWEGHKKEKEKLQQDHWKWSEEYDKAKDTVKVLGTKRVNLLLGIGLHEHNATPEELEEIRLVRSGRYGLGTKRTLEQAIEFTGIDLTNRHMKRGVNRCGNLQWVPYEESKDRYGVRGVLLRRLHGETPERVVLHPPDSDPRDSPGLLLRGGVGGGGIISPVKHADALLVSSLVSSLSRGGLGVLAVSVCLLLIIARFTKSKLFRAKKGDRHTV